MNIKEAIAEIEKRYKVGDKIPCLAYDSDKLEFNGIDTIHYIDTDKDDDGLSLWVGIDRRQINVIYKNGKWSEPIREEKNLWNFFKSIENEYPDVLKRYLKNLDVNFFTNFACRQRSTLISIAFHWIATKEGKDYWSNINDLYVNYLEN